MGALSNCIKTETGAETLWRLYGDYHHQTLWSYLSRLYGATYKDSMETLIKTLGYCSKPEASVGIVMIL